MSSEVRIEVDPLTDPTADPLVIEDWKSYEITDHMMQDSSDFTVAVVPTMEMLKFFRRAGQVIRIFVDETLQMTGIIDAAPLSAAADGMMLRLTGRDFGGLLIDGAARMITYNEQTLQKLAQKLVAPWGDYITEVITGYGADRYKIAGKKGANKNAQVYRGVSSDTRYKYRTRPGDKVWGVLDSFAKDIASHLWMTADGKLVIDRPLYIQETVGKLYVEIDSNANVTDANCEIDHPGDIGDRSSEYVVYGQGTPDANSVGKAISDKFSSIGDPSDSFWLEADTAPQSRLEKLNIQQVRNIKDALLVRRVARTQLEKTVVESYDMTAKVEGHRIGGDGPIWATDTMVDVDFQPREISAAHYVLGRSFAHEADQGVTTTLNLIPPDIWLALDHNTVSDKAYFEYLREIWKRYQL